LLESNLPDSEKSLKRVAQEAQTLVSAGSTTTVHFLKTTIYFILADENVHKRLKAELEKAIPDPNHIPPLHVLKQLCYLDCVVKEGSRLTHGPASRLTRTAPNQNLKFQEHMLPAGTAISMSHFIQHRNANIFPKPDDFNPDRWIQDSERSSKLEKYLVNFSRGARSCLGINLAQVEMYVTLATLFRRFHFELYKTDKSDVEMAHDFFIPYARTDSKGVSVYIKQSTDSIVKG
jgi:cytochrome P450